MSQTLKPRLGISRCLLGDKVRYDGHHKQNLNLMEALGKKVEWVGVCPEVEAGLKVPREPMELVKGTRSVRLLGIHSGTDFTEQLLIFSEQKILELKKLKLAGFIFKKNSPSCGLSISVGGHLQPGLFALAISKAFPEIPIAEEDQLQQAPICQQFINDVYSYWQKQLEPS